MKMLTTKLAAGAVAGVLSVAVTGAVAFAAFQPPTGAALVASTDTGVATSTHAEKDGDALRAVLARLVQNGTLTQAQADAILNAFKTAADEAREKAKERAKEKLEERKEKAKESAAARTAAALLKRVLGNMLKQSVDYIGLPQESVAGQLKGGKTLGEIAAMQPGKSREGLITHITAQITAQIDKLVAEGKVTKERADEAKAKLPEQVAKFVDHKYERKPVVKERKPAENERKPAERGAKKPAASPSAKPTT